MGDIKRAENIANNIAPEKTRGNRLNRAIVKILLGRCGNCSNKYDCINTLVPVENVLSTMIEREIGTARPTIIAKLIGRFLSRNCLDTTCRRCGNSMIDAKISDSEGKPRRVLKCVECGTFWNDSCFTTRMPRCATYICWSVKRNDDSEGLIRVLRSWRDYDEKEIAKRVQWVMNENNIKPLSFYWELRAMIKECNKTGRFRTGVTKEGA